MFPKEFQEDLRQYCVTHYVTYIRSFYILCRLIIKLWWRVVTDGPDAITITKSVRRRTNRHMYTWQSTQKPVVAGKNGIRRCSIAYHVIVYTCNRHQNNICICAICSPSRSDCSALGASESYKCYQGISAQAAVIIGCYTHRHDK